MTIRFYIATLLYFFSITFSLFGVSEKTEKIASEYQLDIGQYLLPASAKVAVSNWLQPTIEDYKAIQAYLSSYRPELSYLNYPGSNWRQKRAENFQLISDNTPPQFGIYYLNSLPSEKTNCIVTYISINNGYEHFLAQLLQSLEAVGWKGHFIYRLGGWPDTEEGSLEFFDVPYAFKIFSIMEAKRLGYKNCLWMDSCFVAVKSLDPIFECINDNGLFFAAYPSYDSSSHIAMFNATAMDISIEEFVNMAYIQSFCIGFNFQNKTALHVLHSWREMMEEKLPFLSFIPELAPLTVIINKTNLLQLSKSECFSGSMEIINSYSETDKTILFWNR